MRTQVRRRASTGLLWGAAALCALVVVAVACTATPAPARAPGSVEGGPGVAELDYVALGDSWTSGPLLPEMTGEPIDCGRSAVNYPSLVAAELGVDSFVDASCGSAKTTHLTTVQRAFLGSRTRPQLDALGPGTDVVTIGIGGNDVGFDGVAKGCINLLTVPLGDAPWGRPCIQKRIIDGVDDVAVRIAETRPKVDAALAGIRERAPHAAVFVVGYPNALPHSGEGCWPQLPMLDVDVRYLRDRFIDMNRMLEAAAAAAGATYVDVYTSSIGHDVCQPYGEAWINTLNIDPAGLPMHPNVLSHQHTASVVAAAIRDART